MEQIQPQDWVVMYFGLVILMTFALMAVVYVLSDASNPTPGLGLYTVYFMAALLTIEAQNTDKLVLYLGECRDLGVPVLPPDLNASDVWFTVSDQGVRFGLAAVKNVGESAIRSMLEVRERLGSLGSLVSLCEEVDLRLRHQLLDALSDARQLERPGLLRGERRTDEPVDSLEARDLLRTCGPLPFVLFREERCDDAALAGHRVDGVLHHGQLSGGHRTEGRHPRAGDADRVLHLFPVQVEQFRRDHRREQSSGA